MSGKSENIKNEPEKQFNRLPIVNDRPTVICRPVGLDQLSGSIQGNSIQDTIQSNNANAIDDRRKAKPNLENQAVKMKTWSDKKLKPAEIGATVRVPVPDVGKGRGDAQNILAVVVELSEYRVVDDMSDDDNTSVEMDFRGDAPPTAMDPYRDNVISAQQQSILNDLRIDLCREDLIYLNNHKEVEAIASLVLKDIMEKKPRDPYAHAANYLNDPRTAHLVANFTRYEGFYSDELLRRDAQTYATELVAVDGIPRRADPKPNRSVPLFSPPYNDDSTKNS